MHATFLRSLTDVTHVLAPKSLPGTSLPVHARCEPTTTFFKMSLHSVGKRYMSVTFLLVTTMSEITEMIFTVAFMYPRVRNISSDLFM